MHNLKNSEIPKLRKQILEEHKEKLKNPTQVQDGCII